MGEQVTRQFLEQMAAGFGLQSEGQSTSTEAAGSAAQVVSGQVLEEVMPAEGEVQPQWLLWLGFSLLLGFFLAGAARQGLTNPRITEHSL